MSLSLAWSYHAPASSMQTLAPASVSTWAAIPPPAPEPTTTTSYDLGLALTCGIAPILLGARLEQKPARADPVPQNAQPMKNPGVGVRQPSRKPFGFLSESVISVRPAAVTGRDTGRAAPNNPPWTKLV